jgi:hypothetical protein
MTEPQWRWVPISPPSLVGVGTRGGLAATLRVASGLCAGPRAATTARPR